MKANMSPILLVDDSVNDVALTKAALEDAHFANSIVVAENGEEAVDYLYKKGRFNRFPKDKPVFILLDINMPLMNGIELLKIIRSDAEYNQVPVIMLTSSRNSHDLRECFDNGANSFVVKPVNIKSFIEVIRDLGKYWVVINEPPGE